MRRRCCGDALAGSRTVLGVNGSLDRQVADENLTAIRRCQKSARTIAWTWRRRWFCWSYGCGSPVWTRT